KIVFPVGLSPITSDEYLNPFRLMESSDAYVIFKDTISIDDANIDGLFALANSETEQERRWGAFTLIWLYRAKLLENQFGERLADVVWQVRDPLGFPKGTGFNKFVFVDLPHPKDV